MPTLKQLYKLWESDREFGITAAHGHGSEHADHVPTPSTIFDKPFSGRTIGLMEPTKDGFKIVPFKKITVHFGDNSADIIMDEVVYRYEDVPFAPGKKPMISE